MAWIVGVLVPPYLIIIIIILFFFYYLLNKSTLQYLQLCTKINVPVLAIKILLSITHIKANVLH